MLVLLMNGKRMQIAVGGVMEILFLAAQCSYSVVFCSGLTTRAI